MFFDSHTHLQMEEFDDDRDFLVNSLGEQQISKCFIVGDDYETSKKAIQLSDRYPHLFYCSAGLHPHKSSQLADSVIDQFKDIIGASNCHAIGEIGLDYHYEFSPKDEQKSCFHAFMEIAHELKKRVIVHNRKSQNDLLEVLKDHNNVKGVIHCFDSNWEFAKKCLDLDYLISFSGLITFKKSQEILEVVHKIPLNLFLIETDCPYLSPHPLRGKRNEPGNISLIAKKVAEIKNIDIKEVADYSYKNAVDLFSLNND